MIKYGIMGIAGLVGLLLMGQVGTDIYSRINQDAGEKLKTEVTRTHHTFQNLDDRFLDIKPPTPPSMVNLSSPDTGAPPPDLVSPNGDPTGEVAENNIPDSTAADAVPTPDKYGSFNSPSDAYARDAMERMNVIEEDLEIPATEYVGEVERFYVEWNTRYENAIHEHNRFAWRVSRADKVAEEYFETQRNLTALMPNRQRQAYFQQKDQEERELFQQWQLQAYDILAQSNLIMDELRQMNLEITKQALSANFAALYRDFHELPLAITSLHDELDLFRLRSEQLEQRFEASFQ